MRVDVGGGVRLFFDVVGAGLEATNEAMVDKPTLLLLHGGPGFDHSGFRTWFDRFADTHQVVYLDLRGHGRSDGHDDPGSWTLDVWADDVVRLCEALDVAEPVVLGNSFGGAVALRYAARHPDHPSRLILSSTQARLHVDASAQAFAALGGSTAAQAYRTIFEAGQPTPEDWLAYLTHCTPLYNRRPSGLAPGRARFNLAVLQHNTESNADRDLRPDLARVRCPTLVLGGNDDPVCPPVSARELVEHLPDGLAQLHLLDDCGHGTFRDQPNHTEQILRRFLAA